MGEARRQTPPPWIASPLSGLAMTGEGCGAVLVLYNRCHCEGRSAEAIHCRASPALDCFADKACSKARLDPSRTRGSRTLVHAARSFSYARLAYARTRGSILPVREARVRSYARLDPSRTRVARTLVHAARSFLYARLAYARFSQRRTLSAAPFSKSLKSTEFGRFMPKRKRQGEALLVRSLPRKRQGDMGPRPPVEEAFIG
jgi:hypothetical protein